jgi:glyceraldehyde 3-phosphate dehydrogenase
VVIGVNDTDELLKNNAVISNASCTTNCAAPLFKVLHDNFGIVKGHMTTIHAYTMTQSMMDDANKEFERSRAAVLNIVPSTSGAAKAVVKVIPDLKGKIEVFAVRVPVPVGSASDLSVELSRDVNADEVNAAFQSAATGSMKHMLEYTHELVMSSDIIGNSHSVVFDPHYTKVVGGNMVKIFGWYDNEWGYSNRVVDLAARLAPFV